MKRFPVAASVLFLLVSACGGGGGESGPIAIDDAPAALGQAFCNAAERCLGPVYEGLTGGPDTCKAEMTAQFADGLVEQWKEKIDAGTIVYDAALMRDCVDAVNSDPCTMLGSTMPSACEDAVQGQVAVGGECALDEECEGTAYCDTGAACPGTCTARKGVSTACNGSGECQEGLACDGTCRIPAAGGEACGGSSAPPCGDGLTCVGEGDATPGTCEEPNAMMSADEGATCSINTGPLCKDGLSCAITDVTADGATWQCVTPYASGAACTFGIPDPCPGDEYCDADFFNDQWQGTCKPVPKVGETCANTFFTRPCEGGAACDGSGTCRAMQDNGGTCTFDGQCYSGYCNASGSCDVPPFCPVQ